MKSLAFLIALIIVTFAVAGAEPVWSQEPISPPEEQRYEILEVWGQGLGDAEHSVLAFRFKVTFMKFDVADIEARLAPTEAATLAGLVREGKDTKSRKERAAAAVLAADTVAFRFTFLRDGGIDRFLEGTRNNLEAARTAGVISGVEYVSVWDGYQRNMGPIVERGSRKGDQLLYRIEKDRIHMVYLGIDGDVLIDATHTEQGWARGIKGTFLAKDANFRDKLVRTLWRD